MEEDGITFFFHFHFLYLIEREVSPCIVMYLRDSSRVGDEITKEMEKNYDTEN